MLKNYSELSDAQVSKLIGTTKSTINAIRDRSHWNTPNIKPQNPVGLGLCSGSDLEKIIAAARARAGKVHSPGAATAPDGIHDHPKAQTAQQEAGDTGSTSTIESTDSTSLVEKKITAESVFGPTPSPSGIDSEPK